MRQAEILFDGQLESIATVLDELTVNESAAFDNPDDTAIAFQIWQAGKLLQRSSNTPDTPVVPLVAGFRDGNFGGFRWRILTRPSSAGDGWIMVAERADIRFVLADQVLLQAVLPIVLGLPVIGLLIWGIVGRGLSPLSRLASQLREKRSDDLTALPTEAVPAELQQVIASTNALLGRLTSAFERERRFAADAAHELRTPISVLKVQTYNLAHELPAGSENLTTLTHGIERLHHLVEQILALYRNTPEQSLAEFVELDLNELVRDVIGANYEQFSQRNQQIELTGARSEIVGDRFALETMVQNLLSNASKYTPEGGRVQVTVSPDEQDILLRVEDSGPGIPETEYERVFERFYRVGQDRHGSTIPGCGLGLAIVKHIVELHNARMKLGGSKFSSGLAVNVLFPRRGAGSKRGH
jgi:two-component system sensor histidine kinase QseC